MRILTHAVLSLIRKPAKAVMIFVILLVVFGLVFTGIIIRNSITKSKEYVRMELGAVVEMRPDYVKAMNNQLKQEEYKQLALSPNMAKEIAKDPAVKTLYISVMTGGSNPNLKSAQNMGKEGGAGMVMATSSIGGDGSPSFPITGSSEFIPIEFEYGSLSLVEGRHRTAEDEGRNTLLVSEEFAGTNNLSIGDTVELKSFAGGSPQSYEVIGLFSGTDSFGVDMMYTSLDSVYQLEGTTNDRDYGSAINFALHDPLEVDAFIARHKDQMPSEYIYLYAADSEYKTLTRPLDLIATITTILLWVVFLAGAIILIAIVTIFVRDRKFEIGLLLSSGEGKLKIISQFVLEIMIVAFLAFFVAAGSSQLSSGYVADWIVSNQLVEEETAPQSGNMISFGPNSSFQGEVSIKDVAESFDIAVNQDTIMSLVLLSFGLILISTGAPLLIILSYKPRESLQD